MNSHRFGVLLLLIFATHGLSMSSASAQPFSTTGQQFVFAIPEGADEIELGGPPFLSKLYLIITSLDTGSGTICSPTGYFRTFTFGPSASQFLELPYEFMLLRDLGFSNKGLIVTATAPISLVFEDFSPEAGETTQILPLPSLGTNYRATTWGLANDPAEDNRVQLVVTAAQDNTTVTITPTVTLLSGEPAGQPFDIKLMKGEVFVAKVDETTSDRVDGLTGTRITATAPVNVISAVTCGYVPLTIQSCNEMLENLLPITSLADTFYTALLGSEAPNDIVLLTSPTANFFAVVNGTGYSTTSGRLQFLIDGPTSIITTAPVQAYQVSEGSEVASQGVSDPSMITILPQSSWSDSLIWQTAVGNFANGVTIIYPAANEASVTYDGFPVKNLTAVQAIPNSQFKSVQFFTATGRHRVAAEVPVFVMVSGFDVADAYSFLPGSKGAPKYALDTVQRTMNLTATPAFVCNAIGISAALPQPITATDDIQRAEIEFTYDARYLQYVSFTFADPALAAQATVSNPAPGRVHVSILGRKLQIPTNVISLEFVALRDVAQTYVDALAQYDACEKIINGGGNSRVIFPILRRADTSHVLLAGKIPSVNLGDEAVLTISILGDPTPDSVRSFSIGVRELPDLLQYKNRFTNLLPPGWKVTVSEMGGSHFYSFTSSTGAVLSGPQDILSVAYDSKVTDSAAGSLTLSGSLSSLRFCPLDLVTDSVAVPFAGKDICGDKTLRGFLNKKPISFRSFHQTPSRISFSVGGISTGEAVADVYDLLGNNLLHQRMSGNDAEFPVFMLPGGVYYLRISSPNLLPITEKFLISR